MSEGAAVIDLDSPVGRRPRRPQEEARRRSRSGSACARSATCSTTSRAATSKTGELTRVDELHEGELLTVVGEIASSSLQHLPGPAHRPPGVPRRRDGPHRRTLVPHLVLRQEQAAWGSGSAQRMPVGRRGIFVGKVSSFRGEWQLTHPQMVLFGVAGRGRRAALAGRDRRVLPDLPAHQGRRLVGPPAGDRVRAHRARRRARRAARPTSASATTCSTCATALRADPRPGRLGRDHAAPSAGSASRRRWSPSWCSARRRRGGARARGPAAHRRATAACSRRSTRGCRSS